MDGSGANPSQPDFRLLIAGQSLLLHWTSIHQAWPLGLPLTDQNNLPRSTCLRGKLALGCYFYCSHHSWIAFEQAISQMNDTATVRRATAIVRLTFLTTSALLRPAHPAAPLPTGSPNCF